MTHPDDAYTEERVMDGLSLELQREFRRCASYEDRWRHVANKAHDMLVEPEPFRVARERRQMRRKANVSYAYGIGAGIAAVALTDPPASTTAVFAAVFIIAAIILDVRAHRSR